MKADLKTEVYSWRVSAQHKAELERQARKEGTSLSRLLERITMKWLEDLRNTGDAHQAALRRRVMTTVGTISSGDPTLASRTREIVRERITQKYTQESNASRRTD